MRALIYMALVAVTVLLASRYVPGVRLKKPLYALLVALVFSVLNWALGGLIETLLVVPGLLTLGVLYLLAPFIANTIVLWITDKVLHVFEIQSAKALLITAGIITVVGGAFRLVAH